MDENKTGCSGCYWESTCNEEERCDYYFPAEDGDDSEEMQNLVDAERYEFRYEWEQYIRIGERQNKFFLLL